MEHETKPKMKYSELKTETQFLKKLAADLVNRFGDSLDAIAFSWMVYALTGSASMTAVTFAVNMLVTVLLTPFSASLLTNWNKKQVMVLCDIGRGTSVIFTATMFFFGLLQPWMVIAVTALNSTLEAFRGPAGMAIFPQIVSREKFALAKSLSGGLSRVAELIGMAAAGIVISTLGISATLWIDAAMFFVSAVILSTLKLPPHVKVAVENAFKEFAKNTREGFAYAAKNHTAMALCGVGCFLNFALTPMEALRAAYVSESLQLSAEALSVIGVSLTVGMGFGSLIVPKLLEKFSRFALLFAGFLMLSISFFFLGLIPVLPTLWIWISLVAIFLIGGVGLALGNTVVGISFMEKIEEEYLARMSGIMASLITATMPLASFLCAAVVKVMSIPHVLLIFGAFAILGSFLSFLVKPLRQL